MKKISLLCTALLLLATGIMAQPKAKTAKQPVRKTTKSKAKIKPVEDEVRLSLDYKTDQGVYMYDFKKGDKLVYHVNAGGNEYDFIVTVNKYSYEKGIDFNYEMTNADKTHGHVIITPEAKDKARNYVNYFSGGDMKLTDASTVWLSYASFTDMPDKKTSMSFDGGEMTTMYRPEKDEVEPVVNIKGEDRTIDAFMINNSPDGTGDKTLWIHGSSANPLILKMNLGFQIELKEIR